MKKAGRGDGALVDFSGLEFSQHHSFICSGRCPHTNWGLRTKQGVTLGQRWVLEDDSYECRTKGELENETVARQMNVEKSSKTEVRGSRSTGMDGEFEQNSMVSCSNLPMPEPILQSTCFWK